MIYMDNVAATKPDKRVVVKMLSYMEENYGNPSSHFYPLGRTSYEAINIARENVSKLINANIDEVIFTSCGTESNNLAIKGLIQNDHNKNKRHIIISETEHISIQNVVTKLLSSDFKVTKLKVDNYGLVNLDDFEKLINKDTLLVSVAHSNPEIGSIQNIESIGNICKNKDVFFHVDAIASCGHVEVDVKKFNCDLLSIAAQNFYGPKGAAALYIREGVSIDPIFDGGYQERGLRAGTENVPAIVGMGEAAKIAKEEMNIYVTKMCSQSKRLWSELGKNIKYLHFTGHPENRLPGHISFWVEFIEGESLLLWFALKDVCVASGSACSSNILGENEDSLVASHVLTAIGVPDDICAGSLMFSLSKYTTDDEIDYVIGIAPGIVEKLFEMSPYYKRTGGKN
jgi:cysteine desulfurase